MHIWHKFVLLIDSYFDGVFVTSIIRWPFRGSVKAAWTAGWRDRAGLRVGVRRRDDRLSERFVIGRMRSTPVGTGRVAETA
jgi:hypothetical protein